MFNSIKVIIPLKIALKLAEARVKEISIALISDNPSQYLEIMKPIDKKVGFHTVCNFILECVDKGLLVNCIAIERPDVNINRVRSLAQSLGAPLFTTYSYHP